MGVDEPPGVVKSGVVPVLMVFVEANGRDAGP